jgi:hypothetical protein
MPSLLVGLLHSDIWELFAGDLTSRAKPRTWDRYWNKIWPEVWLNGGLPLLTGMKRSSRIAQTYGDLEEPLIMQAKREFGKALHSGRLDTMQQQLKREMYRRFWAPHRREITKDPLTHLKHDIYSELQFLEEQNPEAPHWDDIHRFDRDITEQAIGITNLFDVLPERLGGEPRAQASFILDVPAGIPWLSTATLLAKGWPEHCKRFAEDLQMWLDVCENASHIMCLDGVAFVCEKPFSFHLGEQFRLHYDNGPALAYSDGFKEYAWDGVLVPSFVIMEPELITVGTIESMQNIEVRRIMLERYGITKYVQDAEIIPVQEDEFGTLYRREFPGDEALVLLKVINSSPEPDGTFREYFLRVPPDITTARQAVAWTFDIDPEFYDPRVQT